MNARFSLLPAALLSLALCAPASAVTVELFHETFDGNNQNWSYTSTGARSYDKSWTETETVKPGYKGIKLGSTSATGAITSEAFSISNTTADVSIVVVAAAYSNTGGGKEGIAVTVYDATDTKIYTGGVAELTQHSSTAMDEIPATADFIHTFTVPAASLPASGGIYMTIESTYTKTGQRRALLGDVLVTQTYSSGLPALASPEHLNASNIGYTGFSLAWDSVSGATGYSVTVSPSGGTVSVDGTSASVTGLTPGETYTAYVVALGDGTTNDDSAPATLPNIQTTASTVLGTPTGLSSSNVGYFGFSLSWTAVSGANGYTVTLSPAAGTVEVSGTTATATGLAEGVTYTASVVAKGDGTTTLDSMAATLDVTTATAPAIAQPDPTATAVSSSSVTVSWTAQNDASFSVRAWTLVPADVATEDFAGYPDVKPAGWTFNTDNDAYSDHSVIVKLDSTGESVVSPVYPAVASSLSFKLQAHTAEGSSVSVSGSSDGTTWNELTNIVFTTSTKVNEFVLPDIADRGMKVFKWEYSRAKGGAGFGSVSVTGTAIGTTPSYLSGYGPAAAAAGATGVTISNPVAGETNYVEVTATGLSGRTESKTISVDVPSASHPVVISVK